MSRAARLSTVVVTDRYETIRRFVDALCEQTVSEELELVVSCPFRQALEIPHAVRRALAGVACAEAPLLPLGEARAAGVRESSAPVVAIGETHAFPAPDWAEQILQAHEGPWAVVVPSIENANPSGGAQSWSSFLIDYGEWWARRQPAEVRAMPSYNVAFKRAALLSLEPRLGELLEPGSTLAQELARRGERAYFEPQARIEHLNVARPGAWLHERYLGGRLLGAKRRARWPALRTLVYIGGSPLIPVVRLLRTRKAFATARRERQLPPRTTLALVVACVVWAIGELVGYVAGRGPAESRMLEYELDKARYT